jgi:4'-phosphopantetheinyl transferase EntD
MENEDAEWKKLTTDLVGPNIHPDRARGFVFSRQALRECLEEYGHALGIQDLIVENYHQLKGHDSLTLSLSHTPLWGAALIAEKKTYLSVGIDIEPLDRLVKKPILERISHPQDITLNGIALWSLKEASFKALMNTGKFDHPVEFSSLKISQNKWTHSPTMIQGEWQQIQENGLIVSKAWIKN